MLHSFIQWGPACLDRFNGMFAFAIWSVADGKLFLARDPLGMKPLYYTSLPGDQGFGFASEIKAFLALPDFKGPYQSRRAEIPRVRYTFDDTRRSLEGVSAPPGQAWNGRSLLSAEALLTPPAPDANDTVKFTTGE